ncbi:MULTISPECIES: hypothetical protein [unclassified Sedimentibacter]|uniref:hypothetical protein n=1 Tax=unclassified Sedimentibacter TaxID=2649220 RepID=UPI0027DEB879|nr:hypothetical protein [Sedimentibacter sp. MB35-C1]WMJ76665.1 hypothetical protein RBQ61_13885 [Sedimentibacter sp. MB35-C1]
MKSKKFKVLLIVLAFIIAVVIFYGFFPHKQFISLYSKKEAFERISEEYFNMKENFDVVDSLVEKKVFLKNEMEKIEIPAEIYPEEIISDLSLYAQKSKIDVSKIVFSESMPVSLDNQSTDEIIEEKTENSALKIGAMIEFTGHCDSLIEFIDNISNNNKNIAITDINLLSWTGDNVHGTMNLNFYAVLWN